MNEHIIKLEKNTERTEKNIKNLRNHIGKDDKKRR